MSLTKFRFLLAELQLEYVLKEREPRKLEEVLRSNSLPRNISIAYHEIMRRILKEHSKDLALKILSWIFHSKETILMKELQEILSVEAGDTDLQEKYFLEPTSIVEVCQSLVSHDRTSGIVRFTHSTVRDFLLSAMSDRLLSTGGLATTLLTYLLFDIFEEPCGNKSDLKKRMEKYTLCYYAARWWPYQAKGPGERDSSVQALLCRLFQSPGHMHSMFQILESRVEYPSAMSLLHFSAFYGLENICNEILRGSLLACPGFQTSLYPRSLGGNDCLGNGFGLISDRDENDETPLHVSAKKGHKEIVSLLIQANADINARSGVNLYLTPLHLAVIHGHDEVVDCLVKAGATVNAKGRLCGETPLLLAALFGRIGAIEILVRGDADVTTTVSGSGRGAIMWALSSPNAIGVVNALLKAGADVNARDKKGRTALHYALDLHSLARCKEMVEVLLAANAKVNIHCTVEGNTPLHTAASVDLQNRQYELNLHKVKARLCSDSVNELYAQRCAIQTTAVPRRDQIEEEGELAKIISLLLRYKADVTLQNFSGDTPLQCAIKAQNTAAAMMLLRAAGGKVDFTMERLGDQALLDSIERVLSENQ